MADVNIRLTRAARSKKEFVAIADIIDERGKEFGTTQGWGEHKEALCAINDALLNALEKTGIEGHGDDCFSDLWAACEAADPRSKAQKDAEHKADLADELYERERDEE